jgi:hypothetical protein
MKKIELEVGDLVLFRRKFEGSVDDRLSLVINFFISDSESAWEPNQRIWRLRTICLGESYYSHFVDGFVDNKFYNCKVYK